MKYRKKPVIIEAMQFTEDAVDYGELDAWLADQVGRDKFMFHVSPHRTSLLIQTLEGTMVASPGDWVIKGVQGEFYPCKPDIFEATYEAVTDDRL